MSAHVRADWHQVSNDVMRKGLRAKFDFGNHPELCLQLLISAATLDAFVVVENNPFDGYWGVGSHGLGQNKLGLLLMERREELWEWQKLPEPMKRVYWQAYQNILAIPLVNGQRWGSYLCGPKSIEEMEARSGPIWRLLLQLSLAQRVLVRLKRPHQRRVAAVRQR